MPPGFSFVLPTWLDGISGFLFDTSTRVTRMVNYLDKPRVSCLLSINQEEFSNEFELLLFLIYFSCTSDGRGSLF